MEKLIDIKSKSKPKQSRAVAKYLAQYAEEDTIGINNLNRVYDYVVVVPLCNESVDCLETIFSNINNNVLIITVINSPKNKPIWQDTNARLINKLKKESINQDDLSINSILLKFNEFNDVLLVDKNTINQQIPSDNGVGLARKIGCDIALRIYSDGLIKYPWIFSTDGDVILPRNYFSDSIVNCQNYSALVLDFKHFSDDNNLNDLQYLYDFKLRYYHAGIVYAGTTYDYIPLGSTLIVNMDCYAQVRGFPKKNAGEDFYLLNKLTKIKPIKYRNNEIIVNIKSRFSDRVPFGTGPALTKIDNLIHTDEYKYYNPKCFIHLKNWIDFLQSIWSEGSLKICAPTDKNLHDLYEFLNCQKVFENSRAQITSKSRWQQFIQQWFDAFKTLKAVHFFDKKYTRLNYFQLLKTDAFGKVLNPIFYDFIKDNDKN